MCKYLTPIKEQKQTNNIKINNLGLKNTQNKTNKTVCGQHMNKNEHIGE